MMIVRYSRKFALNHTSSASQMMELLNFSADEILRQRVLGHVTSVISSRDHSDLQKWHMDCAGYRVIESVRHLER